MSRKPITLAMARDRDRPPGKRIGPGGRRQTLGRTSEDRIIRLLTERVDDLPEWVRGLPRCGTKAEDSAGWDVILPTRRGNLGIQVKSSESRAARARVDLPDDIAVINGGPFRGDAEVWQELLVELDLAWVARDQLEVRSFPRPPPTPTLTTVAQVVDIIHQRLGSLSIALAGRERAGSVNGQREIRHTMKVLQGLSNRIRHEAGLFPPVTDSGHTAESDG